MATEKCVVKGYCVETFYIIILRIYAYIIAFILIPCRLEYVYNKAADCNL